MLEIMWDAEESQKLKFKSIKGLNKEYYKTVERI